MPIEGFVVKGSVNSAGSNAWLEGYYRSEEEVARDLASVHSKIAERSGEIIVDRVIPAVIVAYDDNFLYRQDTHIVVDFPEAQ